MCFKIRLILLFTVLLLCSACSRMVYTLDMNADGTKLDRQVVFWKESHLTRHYTLKKPFKVELERMAKAYHQATPKAERKKYTFKGQFVGNTPQDIGGAGYWRRYDTKMGSVSYYLERFRGNDDIVGSIERQQQAVDQFATLISGWLHSIVGKQAGWKDVNEYLQTDFRQDLKNLCFYLWYSDKDSIARTILYLAEHGYFTPQQWPDLSVLMEDKPLKTGKSEMTSLLRTVLARKLKISKDSAIITTILNKVLADDLEKSFLAYLRTTDDWKSGDKPDPEAILEDIGDGLALGIAFIMGDKLTIKFSATVAPLETNGVWDAAKKRLTWDKTLSDNRLPKLAYATWIEANGAYQVARFGKIALKDWALLQYVMWYEGLKAWQRQEWDVFLPRLKGDKTTIDLLKKFHFSKEPGVEKSQVQPIRKTLIEALEG